MICVGCKSKIYEGFRVGGGEDDKLIACRDCYRTIYEPRINAQKEEIRKHAAQETPFASYVPGQWRDA